MRVRQLLVQDGDQQADQHQEHEHAPQERRPAWSASGAARARGQIRSVSLSPYGVLRLVRATLANDRGMTNRQLQCRRGNRRRSCARNGPQPAGSGASRCLGKHGQAALCARALLPATMLPVSNIAGPPARSVTMPPASRTSRMPGRHVPGLDAVLPVAVEAAGGDPGEIDARPSPCGGCRRPARISALHSARKRAWPGAAAMGDAGGDHAVGQRLARGHAQARGR